MDIDNRLSDVMFKCTKTSRMCLKYQTNVEIEYAFKAELCMIPHPFGLKAEIPIFDCF